MENITLKDHAVDRLAERYNFKLKHELDAIRFLLNLRQFRIRKQDACRRVWIVSIRLKGEIVQLVYNPIEQVVVTALPKDAKI